MAAIESQMQPSDVGESYWSMYVLILVTIGITVAVPALCSKLRMVVVHFVSDCFSKATAGSERVAVAGRNTGPGCYGHGKMATDSKHKPARPTMPKCDGCDNNRWDSLAAADDDVDDHGGDVIDHDDFDDLSAAESEEPHATKADLRRRIRFLKMEKAHMAHLLSHRQHHHQESTRLVTSTGGPGPGRTSGPSPPSPALAMDPSSDASKPGSSSSAKGVHWAFKGIDQLYVTYPAGKKLHRQNCRVLQSHHQKVEGYSFCAHCFGH